MKKFMIGDLILAIICTISYLMRSPHHMSTLTSSSSVHSTITQTIPLNTTEMIFGAFAVFVLVNIPNIFLILKKSILKITKSN